MQDAHQPEPHVEVHDIAFEGTLLRAPDGLCQACSYDHLPEMPHNQQSMHWKYWFYQRTHEWPTWMDAMAHCDDEMRKFWIDELVDAWHEGKGGDVELQEFLGMNLVEYADWVRDGTLPTRTVLEVG